MAEQFNFSAKERRIITIAGISPDLDGLGYIVDKAGLVVGYQTDLYKRSSVIIFITLRSKKN